MHLLLAASILDPKHLLETFGLGGLVAIIFAETGLLIGFFLPGDSLLVLAGLVCAVGLKTSKNTVFHLHLAVVLPSVAIAAIAGAQLGYFIGRKAGPPLFNKPDSKLFKQEHVHKAHAYFEKYGAKTIIIARFVPIVRTFANPVAGVAEVEPKVFTPLNVIGGLAWTISVTMLGYVLGKTIPKAQDHLALIELVIILLSLTPLVYELVKARSAKRSAAAS